MSSSGTYLDLWSTRGHSSEALISKRSCRTLLGGSWVVISRVISPLIWVIIIVTLLITALITTHEPPSKP